MPNPQRKNGTATPSVTNQNFLSAIENLLQADDLQNMIDDLTEIYFVCSLSPEHTESKGEKAQTFYNLLTFLKNCRIESKNFS
jgi:hypothetical protein